jgi:hypothetical protein
MEDENMSHVEGDKQLEPIIFNSDRAALLLPLVYSWPDAVELLSGLCSNWLETLRFRRNLKRSGLLPTIPLRPLLVRSSIESGHVWFASGVCTRQVE